MSRLPGLAGALALLTSAAALAAGPEARSAIAADADPKAVIAAAHRKADEDLRMALMSPFTAVDAHYLEAGEAARAGADGRAVSFDPAASLPVMGSISYEDGAFWVAPSRGAKPPVIRKATEEGGLAPGDETPVAAKIKLGDGDVVGLDRFLLEMSPQSGKGRILVHDPDSPKKRAFTGLRWFEPSLDLQVQAAFKPDPSPAKVTVGTTRGLKKEYFRAGTFEFEVGGVRQKLTVLAESAAPKDGDDIFIPFRDATTGKESYEVGRYLDMKFKGADARYLIDFNEAGNPNCNYSPYYNCPIPPPENTLTVPIRAGEMTYPGHP